MKRLTEKQLERLLEWVREEYKAIQRIAIIGGTALDDESHFLSDGAIMEYRLIAELAHALEKVEIGKLMAMVLESLEWVGIDQSCPKCGERKYSDYGHRGANGSRCKLHVALTVWNGVQ